MPNADLQNELSKLNRELEYVKKQLQQKQFEAENYKQSLDMARQQTRRGPSPKELNPILKEIRKKNLSMKEKQDILFPSLYPSMPQDIYYQWIAPTRISIQRDRQWYWTMGLLLMIMITIAVIFRELIWVAVILAFFFALYVQASIPASETIYRLTRQGIEIGEGEGLEIYAWQQLLDYSFYFKNNTEVLYIETILSVPQRVQLLFSQEDRKNISMVMESHLPYRVAPKKQGWLARYFDGIYIPLADFKALQEKIDQYYDSKYADIIYQLKREGRIPQDTTVEDIRKAESIQTLQLLEEIHKKQEEDNKKFLGL